MNENVLIFHSKNVFLQLEKKINKNYKMAENTEKYFVAKTNGKFK